MECQKTSGNFRAEEWGVLYIMGIILANDLKFYTKINCTHIKKCKIGAINKQRKLIGLIFP